MVLHLSSFFHKIMLIYYWVVYVMYIRKSHINLCRICAGDAEAYTPFFKCHPAHTRYLNWKSILDIHL